ncbi:MAG: AAA family ATPase, partial [Vulcanimicrobiaceae bacterium]
MRLRALRLFGFKTFAEVTTLAFEPGITAFVGPNGSGKSNLVDAIRWTLGEQNARTLRATRAEEVIFAGNERRRPLGMAEVALTFDNEDRTLALDASEVEIVRRAYRVGESEFFINRKPVRLRDVAELFMGTGLGPGSYAIVSQGQIDAILSAKPHERRALFEETAGTSKFIARKNESLRHLERTEANAVRLSDVLSEVRARIPELETQVRRARRFRKLSARVRDLEILAYLRASAARRAERERLRVELTRYDEERAAASAHAARLEAALGEARAAALGRERELEAARNASTAARGVLAEAERVLAALSAREEVLAAQAAAAGR